jgi:large subunit ribosomal protein L25
VAEVTLKAELRDGRGKGPARRLRAVGKVPATLYGHGIEPLTLAVDARALAHTLSTDAGRNVLIDLEVGSESHLTLARALDRHPLRGAILHVDFLKISRDETITVDIPIQIEGESKGVKEGGVLEHHLWQLHVECLPGNVPERIHVDVTNLAVGDIVHVRDLVPPDGVTILSDGDDIVVSCVVPQVLQVEAEAAEAAPTAEGEAGAPAPTGEGEAKSEES